LAVVLAKPELFHEIDVNWLNDPHLKLYNLILKGYTSPNQNQPSEAKSLLNQATDVLNLDEDTKRLIDFLAILADREFQDQSADALRHELAITEARLRELTLARRRHELEQQMREAERLGDTERINVLLAQFNQLK
jgi:hypothetical protein